MAVTRANVEFAKRILADRVGNDYVYGGNWNPRDTSVGTDCSGLVIDICDAVRNGTGMAWTRHGMSTESWRPIEVGDTGTIFNTVCVADPSHFPPDAVVKIAIHHGPGGGANSHMWCEVDGVRGESNGTDGCVTGNMARSVYDTRYANDWHYIPGPITGITPTPPLSRSDNYALAVIREGQRRGITPRGIQIALATCLVESNLTMYANAKVPESMAIPHDAVGSDGYSVGLFQQQVRKGANGQWWWGDAKTCMDPTLSAGLFYSRLARLDYNGPNSPGSYAQAVQQSAFPDRYGQRMADAVNLYNRLINIQPADLDPILELLMSDLRVPSMSIYATPGEPDIPIVELLRAIDAKDHRELVDEDARRGDPDALTRVIRTAAGRGKYGSAAGPVNHARAILAEIERDHPEYLRSYLKGA